MNDKYSSGAELNEDGSVKKSGDGIHLNSNGYRIMGYCLNIDILFDASVEGFNLYLKPDASTEPLDGKLDVVSNKIIYSMPFNLGMIKSLMIKSTSFSFKYSRASKGELKQATFEKPSSPKSILIVLVTMASSSTISILPNLSIIKR